MTLFSAGPSALDMFIKAHAPGDITQDVRFLFHIPFACSFYSTKNVYKLVFAFLSYMMDVNFFLSVPFLIFSIVMR